MDFLKIIFFRHGIPDISDFAVSEEHARKEYEKFLLSYPGTNAMMSHEEAEQKFAVFHHNLARINYYNGLYDQNSNGTYTDEK